MCIYTYLYTCIYGPGFEHPFPPPKCGCAWISPPPIVEKHMEGSPPPPLWKVKRVSRDMEKHMDGSPPPPLWKVKRVSRHKNTYVMALLSRTHTHTHHARRIDFWSGVAYSI